MPENESSHLVSDYLTRRSLNKLGISFRDISLFEAQYLTIIHNEIERLNSEDIKKASKKKYGNR